MCSAVVTVSATASCRSDPDDVCRAASRTSETSILAQRLLIVVLHRAVDTAHSTQLIVLQSVRLQLQSMFVVLVIARSAA